MGEQPKQTPSKSRLLKKLFYHPSFGVLAGIVGILTGVFGVYSYYASIKEPNLTYYVSAKAPIVKQGGMGIFSVLYAGNTVTNDVSSAVIQIWNQGKAPIKKDDILIPIVLRTPHGEPYYSIAVSTTRPAVKESVVLEQSHFVGSYRMDWNILEQGDGIKIEVVYGGGVDLPIIVEGTIVGQKSLTDYRQSINNPTKQFIPFIRVISAAICFLLFLLILNYYWWQFKNKTTKKMIVDIIFNTVLFGGLFSFLILLVYLTNNPLTPAPKPPFGF